MAECSGCGVKVAKGSKCAACAAARSRELRLMRLFGITPEEYDTILAHQGSKCAICSNTAADRTGRRLAVDHHHKSGLTRGLLCTNCNRLLQKVGENVEKMKAMIAYLEHPPATTALGREVYGRKGRVTKRTTGRRKKRVNRDSKR